MTAPESPSTSSRARAWFSLAVLLALYLIAQIDRNIINLLVEPIRTTFALDDFGMGLLLGPAFGLCYVLFAFPIAWLADRHSRRLIIFTGVAVWALAACACGLAQSFGQLFWARMMVGVGEAALLPSAYVLISELFPRRRLATALSVLSLGSVGGIALSYGLGGWIIGLAENGLHLPIIGGLEPWRQVMFLTGAPGLAVASLVYFIPERSGRDRAAERLLAAAGENVWRFMRRHWRASFAIFFGFGLASLCSTALVTWLPTYMKAAFLWPTPKVGAALGVMIILVATIGKLGSGVLVDRWFARGRLDAHLSYLMVMLCVAAPITIGAFFLNNGFGFLALVGVWFLLAFPIVGYGSAIVQIVTPTPIRGQMSAVFLFVNNLLATTVAPPMVGWLSGNVFSGTKSLGWSMALTIALWVPVAVLVLWQGLAGTRAAVIEQTSRNLPTER